jgi:ABC-type nickel/cobalt efflux system permease component RcnA
MRRVLAPVLALLAILAWPAAASAHPLGNLTINHYAGLHVGPSSVILDVVIDFAEIPAFQERQRIDVDRDGSVSDAETETERRGACARLARDLQLTVAGSPTDLRAWAAGLSFPPGVGGLPTMRVVCQYEAALATPIAAGTAVSFADRSYDARIGWREIVVAGDGATIEGEVTDVGTSQRLTSYPQPLLSQPLDARSVAFSASPSGGGSGAYSMPGDASPLPGEAAPGSTSATPPPTAGPAPTGAPAATPGGITEDISSLVGTQDLSPIAILGTLVIAAGLGAVHALSPGHGKTVMAAYLVGSRGSARHAVGLGLTVTVSHTAGVFALAAITLLASSQLPPERLYPALQLASGVLVVAIGGWLLWGQLRAWRERREHVMTHVGRHDHDHDHDHPHDHDEPHADDPSLEHSHGGIRHTHLPPPGATLGWRSLVSLGLAGGLVPSISALAILLGSLQAQRPAYGLVLVIAFGAGMAVVLAGIGLALVYARRAVERVSLERVSLGGAWGRIWAGLPVATAVVVIVAGVYLTSQSFATVF